MENPGETPEDSSQRTTRGIQPLKDYPERQQQKTTPEDNPENNTDNNPEVQPKRIS